MSQSIQRVSRPHLDQGGWMAQHMSHRNCTFVFTPLNLQRLKRDSTTSLWKAWQDVGFDLTNMFCGFRLSDVIWRRYCRGNSGGAWARSCGRAVMTLHRCSAMWLLQNKSWDIIDLLEIQSGKWENTVRWLSFQKGQGKDQGDLITDVRVISDVEWSQNPAAAPAHTGFCLFVAQTRHESEITSQSRKASKKKLLPSLFQKERWKRKEIDPLELVLIDLSVLLRITSPWKANLWPKFCLLDNLVCRSLAKLPLLFLLLLPQPAHKHESLQEMGKGGNWGRLMGEVLVSELWDIVLWCPASSSQGSEGDAPQGQPQGTGRTGSEDKTQNLSRCVEASLHLCNKGV